MSVMLRRLGAVGLVTIVLGVAGSTTAAAHVGINADDTTEGAYTVLSFDVPHGCEDSGTTDLAIQIPEGIESVTPTVMDSWEIETGVEELDEPQDDEHGDTVSQRVSEVRYHTQDPLPADRREAFELSVKLPDDAAGETLTFPVVQTCEQGEHAWIQEAAEGQDADDLDEPAPSLDITAATAGSSAGEDPTAADEAENGEAKDDEADAAEDQAQEVPAVTYVALLIAVVALVLAGVALARGRTVDET